MTGTIINTAAIVIGGTLGIFFGTYLTDRLKSTVISGMGLFTAAIGFKMFISTENALIVLGALIIGALLGEWGDIEYWLEHLGEWLKRRFACAEESSLFVRGFLTASLLFAIGPMAILGSIQDGLTGNYDTLAIKSVLDFFASIAFSSTLGLGVLFSSLVIAMYQGGISLMAAQLNALVTPAMMTEMTATGGVILIGMAFARLLEIKPIRVGNYLPALVIAPLLVWLVGLFK